MKKKRQKSQRKEPSENDTTEVKGIKNFKQGGDINSRIKAGKDPLALAFGDP